MKTTDRGEERGGEAILDDQGGRGTKRRRNNEDVRHKEAKEQRERSLKAPHCDIIAEKQADISIKGGVVSW